MPYLFAVLIALLVLDLLIRWAGAWSDRMLKLPSRIQLAVDIERLHDRMWRQLIERQGLELELLVRLFRQRYGRWPDSIDELNRRRMFRVSGLTTAGHWTLKPTLFSGEFLEALKLEYVGPGPEDHLHWAGEFRCRYVVKDDLYPRDRCQGERQHFQPALSLGVKGDALLRGL